MIAIITHKQNIIYFIDNNIMHKHTNELDSLNTPDCLVFIYAYAFMSYLSLL